MLSISRTTKKLFLSFVLDQWSLVPPSPVGNTDLLGKTVVVVGANTGIGFETAKYFARMNPAKIVACRSESKEIETATGFKSSEPLKVNLSNFDSVTGLVDEFQSECDRLCIHRTTH